MEVPPLSTAPPTTPTIPNPDSGAKLRLMCSYGGHIVPRPHDKTLCYAGGDTRIIVIDRHSSLADLHQRLSKTLPNSQPFSLKYQLPAEDLDSLITITSDEDLDNMVEEYDRLHNAKRAARLRLFLFPNSSDHQTKPDDWFFDVLNGKSSNLSASAAATDRAFSESSSVNNLLGLDDEFAGKKDADLKIGINQDVHSVPDSPMLDTTSSFGSASSSPSIPNLPRIKVHVEENRKLGIEDQFQQITVNPPSQKHEEEELFTAAGVSAGTPASPLPAVVGGEYRFISDDERSDHGGQRKPQQAQQKQTNAFDLSSPHSVSSDGSATNQLYRQRQAIYHQEQLVQIQSGNSRAPNQVDFSSVDQTNAKIQMQMQMQPQLQESGFVLSGQYDQIQPELHQPQQFIHAGNHYIPSNAVPITPYYSVYPSQPQPQPQPHQSVLDQNYPVYYVSATGRPTPAYNLPMQQPAYTELGQTAPTHPQAAPVASQAAYNHARNVPSSKPEMVGGLYRTAATTAPQTVQVPLSQAQYVGYAPIHHSSPATNPNYGYEFADPAHAQMYYTPLPPQLAAQYQTLKSAPSAPAMGGKDASAPLSAETLQHASR